jgi:lipopolysaccharide export system protein LptA
MFYRLLIVLVAACVASGTAHAQAFRDHNTKAPVTYSADRTEALIRQDRASFSGNVIVRQGDLTLTAQRVTVALTKNRGKDELSRVDASGGVRVTRGNESAVGAFAIYDPNGRLITLIGDVVLNQGTNTIQGNRLTIDLTTGRAVVDGTTRLGNGAVTQSESGRIHGRFTVAEKPN